MNKKRPKYLYEVGIEYARKELYECEVCLTPMWAYFYFNDTYMCPRCAFRDGYISEREFLEAEYYAFMPERLKATVYNGEIYVAELKGKYDFEKTNSDYRQDHRYKEWRREVFERDNFTCQICGQVGKTLNAHHIKTFKDYPNLRFDVNNGITLCEKCHKDLHKRLRKNG